MHRIKVVLEPTQQDTLIAVEELLSTIETINNGNYTDEDIVKIANESDENFSKVILDGVKAEIEKSDIEQLTKGAIIKRILAINAAAMVSSEIGTKSLDVGKPFFKPSDVVDTEAFTARQDKLAYVLADSMLTERLLVVISRVFKAYLTTHERPEMALVIKNIFYSNPTLVDELIEKLSKTIYQAAGLINVGKTVTKFFPEVEGWFKTIDENELKLVELIDSIKLTMSEVSARMINDARNILDPEGAPALTVSLSTSNEADDNVEAFTPTIQLSYANGNEDVTAGQDTVQNIISLIDETFMDKVTQVETLNTSLNTLPDSIKDLDELIEQFYNIAKAKLEQGLKSGSLGESELAALETFNDLLNVMVSNKNITVMLTKQAYLLVESLKYILNEVDNLGTSIVDDAYVGS